jgi:hypothetical protein
MSDIFEKILEKHKEGLAEVSQLALQTGIKYERERIVGLLQALRSQAKAANLSQTANINAIITLIKGDTK